MSETNQPHQSYQIAQMQNQIRKLESAHNSLVDIAAVAMAAAFGVPILIWIRPMVGWLLAEIAFAAVIFAILLAVRYIYRV